MSRSPRAVLARHYFAERRNLILLYADAWSCAEREMRSASICRFLNSQLSTLQRTGTKGTLGRSEFLPGKHSSTVGFHFLHH